MNCYAIYIVHLGKPRNMHDLNLAESKIFECLNLFSNVQMEI